MTKSAHPFTVGKRVTVKEGVSNCKDGGSVGLRTPDGISRAHLVGKKGEIVEVDGDRVLVDDQIRHAEKDAHGNPTRSGRLEMREWFHVDELELG